eukprot:gene7072-biopygen5984
MIDQPLLWRDVKLGAFSFGLDQINKPGFGHSHGDEWAKGVHIQRNNIQSVIGDFMILAPSVVGEEETLAASNASRSVLRYTFTFERVWQKYIIRLFFPIWIVSVLSMAALWVNHEAVPGSACKRAS